MNYKCTTTHSLARLQLILDNNETARRGLVHSDVFIRTLEANNIFFPRRIARALVGQFQTPNGGVQAAKFLKWIELSRPADHVDPELMFARLPQPYRRIVKILDKDILDASWELIKQQSARFKAETAAALAATARSNRDTVDSVADPDDYEGAKKRCCKIFDRKDLGGNHRVVRIAQHDTLPVVVVALEVDSSETPGHTPVMLQLFSTLTHEHIAEYTLPTTGNGEPSSPDLSFKRYQVTGLTPIRVRSVTQDGGRATLTFGIRVTEFTTVPASEEQPESSSYTTWIHVFEAAEVDIFALSIPGGGAAAGESKGSFRMAATGKFEHLEWLEMSPDGQCVAFATVPGSISVFMIATNANAEERLLERISDDTPAIDFNTAAPLMKIDCGALQIGFSSVSRLHFVVKPTLKRTLPSSRSQPPGAYALVVCYSTRVTKYILSSSSSANAVPIASWDHLAEITSSTMDATTQFLAVGLADGAVVVWDTFEDAHHVYLSPSMTAVSESSSSRANACDDPRIDAVVVYRNEFIVALSSLKQQVRFFDIRKRVAPQLHRIVTAPAPPTTLQQGEGVKLGSLVKTVNVLDVPIAIIGYSNGTHMLYDLRTATAIGSIRSRSQANRGGQQTTVLACQHGVVAAQSSLLDFYDWYQLLLASYPSFEHILKQRDLKQVRTNPISRHVA